MQIDITKNPPTAAEIAVERRKYRHIVLVFYSTIPFAIAIAASTAVTGHKDMLLFVGIREADTAKKNALYGAS